MRMFLGAVFAVLIVTSAAAQTGGGISGAPYGGYHGMGTTAEPDTATNQAPPQSTQKATPKKKQSAKAKKKKTTTSSPQS